MCYSFLFLFPSSRRDRNCYVFGCSSVCSKGNILAVEANLVKRRFSFWGRDELCRLMQMRGPANVCCQGMACVGRSKVCTLVAANHFGPIPGVQVGSQWKFRVQVGHTSSFCICHTAMRTVTSFLSVTQLWWNFRVQVRHIDSLKRVFLSPIQRVSWPLSRHVSFMRMCDCHVFHILPHFCIFQQSAHITYFFWINWHFWWQFLPRDAMHPRY